MVSPATAYGSEMAARGPLLRSTTVLLVRRDGKVCMAQRRPGDARQRTIVKQRRAQGAARRQGQGAGRASPAAAPTPWRCSPASRPSSRSTSGNLERAVVELAKDWRTDRALRQLQAMMIVADHEKTLPRLGHRRPASQPDERRRLLAIGSGGNFALAAARALLRHTTMSRRGDRPRGDAHRRRDLHLHQRPPHARGAGVDDRRHAQLAGARPPTALAGSRS